MDFKSTILQQTTKENANVASKSGLLLRIVRFVQRQSAKKRHF
jgi:hypothetical protein